MKINIFKPIFLLLGAVVSFGSTANDVAPLVSTIDHSQEVLVIAQGQESARCEEAKKRVSAFYEKHGWDWPQATDKKWRYDHGYSSRDFKLKSARYSAEKIQALAKNGNIYALMQLARGQDAAVRIKKSSDNLEFDAAIYGSTKSLWNIFLSARHQQIGYSSKSVELTEELRLVWKDVFSWAYAALIRGDGTYKTTAYQIYQEAGLNFTESDWSSIREAGRDIVTLLESERARLKLKPYKKIEGKEVLDYIREKHAGNSCALPLDFMPMDK